MVRRGGGWRGARRSAIRTREDRGTAVLETAIGIPVLLGVGTAMLWGIGVGLTTVHMADTARDAARALARGEAASTVLAAASRQSPSSMIDVTEDGESVTVRVRRTVTMPVLRAVEIDLDQQATAVREQWW